MPGQETDYLPGYLQGRHPTVEVDPVKALQIQTDMPVEDVVHRHQPLRHHDHLRTAASRIRPGQPSARSRRSREGEGRLGPLPSPPETAADQTYATNHLGGPRLASLEDEPVSRGVATGAALADRLLPGGVRMLPFGMSSSKSSTCSRFQGAA